MAARAGALEAGFGAAALAGRRHAHVLAAGAFVAGDLDGEAGFAGGNVDGAFAAAVLADGEEGVDGGLHPSFLGLLGASHAGADVGAGLGAVGVGADGGEEVVDGRRLAGVDGGEGFFPEGVGELVVCGGEAEGCQERFPFVDDERVLFDRVGEAHLFQKRLAVLVSWDGEPVVFYGACGEVFDDLDELGG